MNLEPHSVTCTSSTPWGCLTCPHSWASPLNVFPQIWQRWTLLGVPSLWWLTTCPSSGALLGVALPAELTVRGFWLVWVSLHLSGLAWVQKVCTVLRDM